jgi:hypothetical protein
VPAGASRSARRGARRPARAADKAHRRALPAARCAVQSRRARARR